MGKKNRLKQLLGRFNKETNCEIKSLRYSLDGITRDMLLKIDLKNEKCLAIANVPYFLDEESLKQLCLRALGDPVVQVQMTSSNALGGDPKKDYRSGYLHFATTQARRRAFDAISSMPFNLEVLNIKLPVWHKPLGRRRIGKRRYSASEETVEVDETKQAQENAEDAVAVDINKPDEDGWITVTKKHKFSFRGKINKPGEVPSHIDEKESGEIPSKKKRRR